MKKRSLSLRREALTDLSAYDLGAIAGGAQTVQGPTCPLIGCLTGVISDQCYTRPCPSIDC
ncbi:MAG TPA: hypothetical protein VGX28_12555 [Frankiaceae bacterium]|nr:hypothetical protein [Frankiaceae bacterium]